MHTVGTPPMFSISATADRRLPPSQSDRIVAGGLGLVVAAVAIFVLVLLAQRQRQRGYAMVAVLVVAAVCVLLTLGGAALATHRRQPVAPWLTLLTTLLFVTAYVTMFSFGVLFLGAGILSLLARLRVRNAQPSSSRSHLGAGLLLSLGFVPRSLLAVQGPVVSCMPNGIPNSAPLWTWFGGGGLGAGGCTGAYSSASNQASGTVTVAGTYSYTCAGGRLVRFSS
jgi:hypothetical protein